MSDNGTLSTQNKVVTTFAVWCLARGLLSGFQGPIRDPRHRSMPGMGVFQGLEKAQSRCEWSGMLEFG